MDHLKVLTAERKLTLPVYRLSEKKSRLKSCFIDSNRVDTVKSAKAVEVKKRNGIK